VWVLLFPLQSAPVLEPGGGSDSPRSRSQLLSAGSVRVRQGHAKLHGACFLQESVAATVNELERLDTNSMNEYHTPEQRPQRPWTGRFRYPAVDRRGELLIDSLSKRSIQFTVGRHAFLQETSTMKALRALAELE